MQCTEGVHVAACKMFLNVPKYACNNSVVGDLARSMYVYSCKRCIKYWIRITRMPNTRLVKKWYVMMKLYDNNGHTNWATFVRKHLYENGFGYAWEQQNVQNPKLFIYNYVQRIKDQYIQRWRIECANNSKLKTCYMFYKNSYYIEQYVYDIDIVKLRRILAMFRSGVHCLSI